MSHFTCDSAKVLSAKLLADDYQCDIHVMLAAFCRFTCIPHCTWHGAMHGLLDCSLQLHAMA